MNLKRLSAFSLVSALLFVGMTESATAQSKKRRDDITYFQDLAPSDTSMRISNSQTGTAVTGMSGIAATAPGPYIYRLQPGDILAIAVSSLNAEADAFYNPFARSGFSLASGANNTQENNNLPIGYRVSEAGTINFPKLGSIRVSAVRWPIWKRCFMIPSSPTCASRLLPPRLLNFKISLMGEVNRPSVYTVQNERITLTEAISLAGDLTVYGKRENVMIIRENAGQREFIRVDLTQRNTFTSSAYYLKPNDVIYVEPKSSKKIQASRTLPYIPAVLGGITLLATVILNLVR